MRSRDVTFDDDKFYDPKDLDLEMMLQESSEKIIQTSESCDWNEDEIKDDQIEEIIIIPSNLYYDEKKEYLTQESGLSMTFKEL